MGWQIYVNVFILLSIFIGLPLYFITSLVVGVKAALTITGIILLFNTWLFVRNFNDYHQQVS
jgi:hypothetical protein